MSRTYTAEADGVSLSAPADLISLQSTSGMVFELDELDAGQVTATAVANLKCTFKRFSGAYTIGSSGSSATPRPHVFGDSAATVTARAGDTTQTSGGTSVKLGADVINVVNGYQKLPAPEDRYSFTFSQAFVWSLDTAPASAETFNLQATFRENV